MATAALAPTHQELITECYELLGQHRITPAPGRLPSGEEINGAYRVVAAASEFFVEPLCRSVFELLNEETLEITWADLGRLLYEVGSIRDTLRRMLAELEKVEACRDDLGLAIESDGRITCTPSYDERGRPMTDDWARAIGLLGGSRPSEGRP